MDTMYDYLYSEEVVLQKAIENYIHPVTGQFSRLFIIGCGSSFNTGKIVEPILLDYGMAVSVLHPVEFMTTQHNMKSDDLAIFISQVGNSALVIKALRSVKGKCITMGLSANDDGSVANEADHFINIGCGEEDWNAKSKGVSCTVLTLLLFGMNVARERHLIDEAAFDKDLGELLSVISKLRSYTEELEAQMDTLTAKIEPHNMLWMLSTGYNYSVTREFAMKVTECAYLKATHKELEEYLHGFEMGVNKNDTFIIYAFDEVSAKFGKDVKNFLIENKLTDNICIISNRKGDIHSSVPDGKFNIFVGLAFLQLVAYKLSVKFGIDAKQLRYKNINEYVQVKL